jgi:hypothetical protein
VDNLIVPPPFYSFMGFIPYEQDSLLELSLPSGWSLRYDSTGVYTIIHNLSSKYGIKLYSIVACPAQSTNAVVSCVISTFKDETTISWFDTATQTVADTSFMFIITTGTNPNIGSVPYLARNISEI